MGPTVLSASDIDWGDFPTWAGAIASTLALVFAAIAARAAYAVYRIESQRDALAERDRGDRHEESLRAQASMITGWVESRNESVMAGGKFHRLFWMKVKNAHNLPIYDVSVYFCIPNGCGYAWLKKYKYSTIPPGDLVRIDPQTTLLMRAGEDGAGSGRVAIMFRDSASIVWWRNIDGRLLRQKGDEVPLPPSPLRDLKIYTEHLGQREEFSE